tara:strand:- start:6266 stop:6532 length:267 start_codon:yes stop_codon:yes gene_type:complete
MEKKMFEQNGRELIESYIKDPVKRGRPPTGKERIKVKPLALDVDLMEKFQYAKEKQALKLGFKLTNKQFFTMLLHAYWDGVHKDLEDL